MEVNNHSDSLCWNNDTASRKGLQSLSSHMVNSTLAQQLSQQYFASRMQPPSTELRDAQPRSVTEQVGRVEFNVARDGTDFLPQIHFPRYPTPTPPPPIIPAPPTSTHEAYSGITITEPSDTSVLSSTHGLDPLSPSFVLPGVKSGSSFPHAVVKLTAKFGSTTGRSDAFTILLLQIPYCP